MLQQRKHSFPEIHELACNKLTNINGKAGNKIPEAVNKLTLLVSVGHTCEIG